MPDPAPIQTAQLLLQSIKSSALTALLKSGPQRGQVTAQQQGRVEINIRGHKITVEAKQTGLKLGQPILAKMAGGKVYIEPQPIQPPPVHSQSTRIPPGANSILQTLNQMGFSGSQFEALAQALVQAGIPLNPSVLQELAKVLPQFASNQINALQFLLSRGLPINSGIMAFIAQLFSQKNSAVLSVEQFLNALDELDQALDHEEPAIDPVKRRQLRDHRQALARHGLDLQKLALTKDGEALKQLLQYRLTSAEAALNKGGDGGSLAETLLRLMALVEGLKTQTSNPKLAEWLQRLYQQAQQLYESHNAQLVKNLPPQGQEAAPAIFLQIPFREDEANRHLQMRYQQEHDGKDGGRLDLRFELSRLGPMWIQFYWQPPALAIALVTGHENTAQFLEPRLDELQRALQDKGYHEISLKTRSGEVPDTLAPEEEDQQSLQGLDLRA